jgi:hypothetical protein
MAGSPVHRLEIRGSYPMMPTHIIHLYQVHYHFSTIRGASDSEAMSRTYARRSDPSDTITMISDMAVASLLCVPTSRRSGLPRTVCVHHLVPSPACLRGQDVVQNLYSLACELTLGERLCDNMRRRIVGEKAGRLGHTVRRKRSHAGVRGTCLSHPRPLRTARIC